jgi:hypothetical protein
MPTTGKHRPCPQEALPVPMRNGQGFATHDSRTDGLTIVKNGKISFDGTEL